MTRRLDPAAVQQLLAGVDAADAAYAVAWPGRPTGRQPVQVLYVPADQITPTTTSDAGRTASDLVDRFAPDVARFADLTGLGSHAVAGRVHQQVITKLRDEPVEDLRIDFEDGYLGRSEEQEDADARAAAGALAAAIDQGIAPPFFGLRVKSFSDGLARRSVATLDRFLGTLLDNAGQLPPGFVITFPKIVSVDHVKAFVDVLAALEQANGLAEGALGFEAQIETTASVLGPDGVVALRGIRQAGAGRLRACHFGVFDYTAALGLPAEGQRLDHPGCDLARHLMQITFAGTEVMLSDGSTNVRPANDSIEELHRVWRSHAAHVRHSLAHGFTQGWDLHPSHLVSRYATVFAHLLSGLDGVIDRLAAWQEGQSSAAAIERPTSGIMDEPATITVLTRHLQRAVDCGAISQAQVDHRFGRD
ncbi:MAG: DUF6986 family protein [Euzebya sp.]